MEQFQVTVTDAQSAGQQVVLQSLAGAQMLQTAGNQLQTQPQVRGSKANLKSYSGLDVKDLPCLSEGKSPR